MVFKVAAVGEGTQAVFAPDCGCTIFVRPWLPLDLALPTYLYRSELFLEARILINVDIPIFHADIHVALFICTLRIIGPAHGRVHLIARPIQETSVNERNAAGCCVDARFKVYSRPTPRP